jgi:hypothetical protein
MRLICAWRQRQLARYAVLQEPPLPGSGLSQHLNGCPECAAVYHDLIRLGSEVQEQLPLPTLPLDFDVRLMTRLAAAETASLRPARMFTLSRTFTLGGAFAITLIGAGLLWQVRRQASPVPAHVKSWSTFAQRDRKAQRPGEISAPKNPLAAASPDETPGVYPGRAMASTVPFSNSRSQSRHRRRHHHRAMLRALASSVGQSRSAPLRRASKPANALLALQVAGAGSWDEQARVYEACGDYSHASAAYSRAFTEQPDADMAIAAGETAERTGDASGALTYLARALAESGNDPTADGDSPQNPVP